MSSQTFNPSCIIALKTANPDGRKISPCIHLESLQCHQKITING